MAPDGTIWLTEGYEGGAAKGKIAHLDPSSNTITEFTPPNAPSGCDGITVAASGGMVRGERRQQYRLLLSGPVPDIPAAARQRRSDKYRDRFAGPYLVTEQYGNAIAVYNVNAKTWKEYPIPNLSGQPSGIAIDSHDNIWFTEYGPGKIGVLPAGSSTITDFLIPTPRCGPEDITIGADGSVCFTEQYGNKIGQISVAGLTAR